MIRNWNLLRGCRKQCFMISQKKTMSKKKTPCDIIGPRDPISNLHPIKYAAPENETALQLHLRKSREQLQEWNEMFWTKHNLNFIQRKREFENNELAKKGCTDQVLSADEISVFYKKFLDDNWKIHLRYLFNWYKKTFYVNYLHFRVILEKLYRKNS